jgi:hypothetical protein
VPEGRDPGVPRPLSDLFPVRLVDSELGQIPEGWITIDWTLRENVRAHLRVLVKRILRKHGYPPDKQERANGKAKADISIYGQESNYTAASAFAAST